MRVEHAQRNLAFSRVSGFEKSEETQMTKFTVQETKKEISTL
jgi:hypothetical protein